MDLILEYHQRSDRGSGFIVLISTYKVSPEYWVLTKLCIGAHPNTSVAVLGTVNHENSRPWKAGYTECRKPYKLFVPVPAYHSNQGTTICTVGTGT